MFKTGFAVLFLVTFLVNSANSPRNIYPHLRCYDSTWEFLPENMRSKVEWDYQHGMLEQNLRGKQ